MKIQLLLVVMLFVSTTGFAEDFFGVPYFVIVTSENGANEASLSEAEMRENVVVIQQNSNGEYIWITRENAPLRRAESGIYVTYTAVNGSGYVKLNELNGQFIEHVHLGLSTITYYGVQITEDQ